MNRKEFLVKGGLAATSFAVGMSYASGSVVGKALEPINLGVIGSGDRGKGLIQIMKEIPGVNVMACCDIVPFRLKAAMAEAHPKAKEYTDYRRILDDKKINAVLIATPLYLHSAMAIDALDAGKHVYCEKTMAYDIDQTIRLVEKVKNSKKIFQVGHQYHSSRLYYNLVDIINQGHIGKITHVVSQWNRNGDWRRPVPDPRYEKIINWRMYREYSGGLLAELSSHQIDFVNWITNAHPVSVIGTGGIDYWKDGRETHDNTHVIFDYPDGVKATFTCLTANAYDDYQIKVLGDKATMIIRGASATIIPEARKNKILATVDGVSGATSKWSGEDPVEVDVTHEEASKQALIDFFDSIRENKEPISNVITGAKTSISVRMAINAIESGTRIEWNDAYKL